MSKKKSAIVINDKRSWFNKCLERIEAGKAPFPKKKKK